MMLFLTQTALIIRKDLLIEWRSKARFSGVLFFAFALILLMGMAMGPNSSILRQQAGATIWIGLLLASTRSLDQSFAIEMEDRALLSLVLHPVHPAAIYYGKALTNTLILFGVAAVLLPLSMGMFDATLKGNPLQLLAVVVLGCAALAAPGTLYALITVQARGASVLLPLLLFPLVVPAMIASARGTTLVLQGDPMEQTGSWIGLLIIFNLIHWTLSGVLFARLLDEG